MTAPRVLVVEDNPVTRKLIRITLASVGCTVVEAPDGRTALALLRERPVDLILQDLLLPDMDGVALIREIRALPHGADVPILVVSGFLSRMDEARAAAVGLTDFIAKPVEPSRLLDIVRAYLPGATPPETLGQGRRILVVDDDPVQAKVLALRLGDLGFRVVTASDGAKVLEEARRAPPDAIVSDVLMPGLDGFRLCAAIRRDPALAGIPVVLASSYYTEDADRAVASQVGANDLVLRTPDFKEVIRALTESLGGGRPAAVASPDEGPTTEYLYRVVRQLERQLLANQGLARRASLQAAELSALGVISSTLGTTLSLDVALGEILARCLDVGGVSRGALYLVGVEGRLRLQVQIGYEGSPEGAETFFGHPDLLERIVREATVVALPSPGVPDDLARDLLEWAGSTSLLVVPIVLRGEPLGALVLGSKSRDLTDDEWVAFIRTAATEIGQALLLGRAFARMNQSEKLAAMGQLLAGVAHELNNPLSVVIGQATLLARIAGEGPLATRAEKIVRAAERCARIVNNFLALARQRPIERQSVVLSQVVQEALDLLAYPLRVDSVSVTLDLAADLPRLWADPHQLHQVIVNLVTNAHQAMHQTPPPRRLTVVTRPDPGGVHVLLEVRDSGPGIPPEIQARIFEPFFTTKPAGQGTGLGLSMCHGIVGAHGGQISVESEPGRGTAFRVLLPAETPADARGEPGARTAVPVETGKTILVVDDEAEVAAVLADMLAADDHRVDTVADGRAALAKLAERAYDLILCDLRMPELDGPGLYREVEQRRPELCRRFIFLTGDTLSTEAQEFLETSGAASLAKPFPFDEVREVVQAALRRNR